VAKAARSNTRRLRSRRPTHHGLPAGTRSFVGWIELSRAGGRIAYRSAIERDALIRLGLDHGVASVQRNDLSDFERLDFHVPAPTPNRVFTLPDGSLYTPDLQVRTRSGHLIFVELGPDAAKTTPVTAERLEMARVEATKIGADLLVLTERLVRGRGLENARRLIGRLHPIADAPQLIDEATAALRAAVGPRSVGSAAAALAAANPAVAEGMLEDAVWCALARAAQDGELLFALDDIEIDASSEFAVASEATSLSSWFERVLAGQHDAAAAYEPPLTSLAAPVVVTTTLDLSEADGREYQLRLAIVRDRQANRALTWAELAERHGVSTRKARYFYREWEDYGEAELRPHQRKATGVRAPFELLKLAEKLWRNSRKLRLRAILEHPEMVARARELGARLSYDQLWRYSRTLRGDPVATARRDGKRIPPAPAFGPVDPLKKVSVPLQVIQVDAARADIFVLSRDGRSVLERPWILWAIDVATRCVWSWLVCEGTPSEVDYLRLMRRGFLPKDALARACGAQNSYPVHGIPQLVLCDRGWIFSAQRSRERLAGVGVIVENAAPYRPDMKGIVERLIGTINERWIHRLPGTTLSSIQQRSGYDSVSEAKKHGLTLERFERLLAQAVIDGYSQEVHSSIKATPVEQWLKLCQRYGQPRAWPNDPGSELRLNLFALKDGETRERDHRGYFFQNLVYRPAAKDAPDRARVLYDPDDLRSISIFDAATGMYSCEATARDIDLTVAISERELKEEGVATKGGQAASGTAALSHLVAQVEAGKPISKRDATRIEKAVRAAHERWQWPAEAVSSSTAGDQSESATVPELELDAVPDFEEHTA
jgi:transposase InsO family protein